MGKTWTAVQERCIKNDCELWDEGYNACSFRASGGITLELAEAVRELARATWSSR